MAHDVLISYATHDKPKADAICNRLESQGIRCWIAPRDVPLGTEYADSIVQAIEASKVMVLVYGSHTSESNHVKREAECAVRNGITIIPVKIEDAEMTEAFQYYVGSMHWLDAITPPLEQHIDKLASDLKAILSKNSLQGVEGGAGKSPYEPKRVDRAPEYESASPGFAATGQPSAPPPTSYKPRDSGEAPSPLPGTVAQDRPTSPDQRGPVQPGTKQRRMLITAAGLAVVAVSAVIAYILSVRAIPSGPAILVPAVSGLSKDVAIEKLRTAGLKVGEVTEERDDREDFPTAIGTSPAAGEGAKKGEPITLYVSGMVLLPKVVELTVQKARKTLDERGLKEEANVQEKPSSKPAGTVIGMAPDAGTRVLRTERVTLDVASGKVAVPDVSKVKFADAEKQIKAARLEPVRVDDWSPGQALDTVITTEPRAGHEVSPGDKITLSVVTRGGWLWVGDGEWRRPIAGATHVMRRDGSLRAREERAAPDVGVVRRGEAVKVLEVASYDWIKVVVVKSL